MSERTRGFGGGSSSTVGAVLWLFCFQYFVGEQIARVGWDRGAAAGVYSMARNYISDLGAVRCGAVLHRSGVICSPWHGLMNGSFILQGCLIFAGSLLVRRLFPRGQLCGVGLWVIAVSGLGECGYGAGWSGAADGAWFRGVVGRGGGSRADDFCRGIGTGGDADFS
jgi:hypothetical protein